MPQISELFSTFLSSGGRFNTLVESLLDAMSRHERACLSTPMRANSGTASAHANGAVKVFASSCAFLALALVLSVP